MSTARHIAAVSVFVATLLSASCVKSYPDGLSEQEYRSRRYVNSFAKSIIEQYYLWKAEVQQDLDSWKVTDNPAEKVKSLRYSDPELGPVDRWTTFIDDIESFIGQINGNTTTFGLDFALSWGDADHSVIYPVITFVYKDSPAAEAGLKRGDVLTSINSQAVPVGSYQDFVKQTLLNSDHVEFTLRDGREISLDARQMYCDPVVEKKIFEVDGSKIAYLFYTSYTMDSQDSLKAAFAQFKEAGARELILDLRYNAGGYDVTNRTLASLIAPSKAVENEEVFNVEIYNEDLARYIDANTCFDKSCLEANIDARSIVVIMTGSTASASEATICGLDPYLPVFKLGTQSYGKFCGGFIFEGSEWYDSVKSGLTLSDWENGKRYAANKGLYVMASRYADRDGNTPCMPNGYTPDMKVSDNPLDGHQIGDPEETMLSAALSLFTLDYGQTSSSQTKTDVPQLRFERPASGILILD